MINDPAAAVAVVSTRGTGAPSRRSALAIADQTSGRAFWLYDGGATGVFVTVGTEDAADLPSRACNEHGVGYYEIHPDRETPEQEHARKAREAQAEMAAALAELDENIARLRRVAERIAEAIAR